MRLLLTLVLALGLGCTAVAPSGSSRAFDDDDVVEPGGGKADDYLSPLGQEYDFTTTLSVELSEAERELESEARLERARELALLKMGELTAAVDSKVWSEWTEDDRRGDQALVLRVESGAIDDLQEVEAGRFEFSYLVEAGGPKDLFERFPFTAEGEKRFLEVELGFGDAAEAVALEVRLSEDTPDAYPKYAEMLEGGLDIAIHFGDDHYDDEDEYNSARRRGEKDIAQAENIYDLLTNDLDFETALEFDELGLDSPPLVGSLDVDGRAVEVRVRIFHANMIDHEDFTKLEELDKLVDAYKKSAATADVVIYSGHAGRNLNFSGVILHYPKTGTSGDGRASIPGAQFKDMDLPEKYQLFVFAGCETYVGYSDKIFEHKNKNPETADVITTVNFSTSRRTPVSTRALLSGILDQQHGTWLPHSWSSLLKRINDADAGSTWTAMFGVHGLSANPRLSPLADPDTVGQACGGQSDCPGIDNRCVSRSEGGKQCGAACTHDSGCPSGSRCVGVTSRALGPLRQCLTY